MPLQIEINDLHIDSLIDFYIQRLKVLRDEISEREKETKEINAQILKLKRGKTTGLLGAGNSQISAPSIPYSEKWPWVRKIRFALENQGRPLTTKEIVDTLIEYEIGLMFDRKKVVASVSSMLSTKSGDGKEFARVESDSGDFAYDLNNKNVIDAVEIEELNPFD